MTDTWPTDEDVERADRTVRPGWWAAYDREVRPCAEGSRRREELATERRIQLDRGHRFATALLAGVHPPAVITDEAKIWRCYQCDEIFTDPACAKEHFGEYQDCTPICKVGAERYRDLENQLAAFRSESDEASKTFYRLGGDHAHALIKAEQSGYDKGLSDGKAERALPPAVEELVEAAKEVYRITERDHIAWHRLAALEALEAGDNVHHIKAARLKAFGVSRDGENDRVVLVSFSRRLTDDELRFFHDVCARTAPLMEEEQ